MTITITQTTNIHLACDVVGDGTTGDFATVQEAEDAGWSQVAQVKDGNLFGEVYELCPTHTATIKTMLGIQ